MSSLTELLSRWHLSLEQVAGVLPPLAESAGALLVGSITEGLGNDASDIDVLVLGGNAPDANGERVVFREGPYEASLHRVQGREVHVDYWQGDNLERLARRFDIMVRGFANPSGVACLERLGYGELLLLHRIRTGVPLVNGSAVDAWRQRLQVEYLADYLVLWFINAQFSDREDAIAQAHEGEHASTLVMLRLAAESLIGALISSVGETNPYPKWRVRLLERHAGALALGEARVDELMNYLIPDRRADPVELVRRFCETADAMIVGIFQQRPHLVPGAMEIGSRVTYVKHLEEMQPQG